MNDLSQRERKNSDETERRIFLKAVGIRVRQLREHKKWTQEKLAQEAQINDKYVYDLETGNKCMTIWVLTKISKALGVEAERLLVDEIDNE